MPATTSRRSHCLDLTTREFRGYLEQFNLRCNFIRLRELIEEGRRTQINKCIESWDVDGIKYFIDEMAGEPSDTDGDGLFSRQLDDWQEGMELNPLGRRQKCGDFWATTGKLNVSPQRNIKTEIEK